MKQARGLVCGGRPTLPAGGGLRCSPDTQRTSPCCISCALARPIARCSPLQPGVPGHARSVRPRPTPTASAAQAHVLPPSAPVWPAPPVPAASASRWLRPPPRHRSGPRTWPPPHRRAPGTLTQSWWGSGAAGTACTGCSSWLSSPGSCIVRRVVHSAVRGGNSRLPEGSLDNAPGVLAAAAANGGGGADGGAGKGPAPLRGLDARTPLTGSHAGTRAAAPWLRWAPDWDFPRVQASAIASRRSSRCQRCLMLPGKLL